MDLSSRVCGNIACLFPFPVTSDIEAVVETVVRFYHRSALPRAIVKLNRPTTLIKLIKLYIFHLKCWIEVDLPLSGIAPFYSDEASPSLGQ